MPISPTCRLRDSMAPTSSKASATANTASAGLGWVKADKRHHKGCLPTPSTAVVFMALFSRRRCDRMMGNIILLVMIISNTPRQAVMPSSRTMGISICMMTMNPRALVTNATVPGMNSLRMAACEASIEVAPLSISSFQALVICTACDTPMEKIRKGTSIEIGSIPMPISGSKPSSQTTGNMATTRATAVSLSERQ